MSSDFVVGDGKCFDIRHSLLDTALGYINTGRYALEEVEEHIANCGACEDYLMKVISDREEKMGERKGREKIRSLFRAAGLDEGVILKLRA